MSLDEKREATAIELLIGGRGVGQIRLKNYPDWATIQVNRDDYPRIGGPCNDLEFKAESKFFLDRVQVELK